MIKEQAVLFVEYNHKKEFVKAAAELGYKTVLITAKPSAEATTLFDRAYEADTLDIDQIDKIVPEIKKKYYVKGVITAYEKYVIQRSYLAERFALPATSVYSACCTRNKYMQRRMLHFMPENISYTTIESEHDLQRAMEKLGGDVCLKSISGIKSQFIHHVTGLEEAKQVWKAYQKAHLKLDTDLYNNFESLHFSFNYPDPRNTLLAEKMIYGKEISVQSFVSSHQLWHAPSICDVYCARDLGRNDTFLAFRILPSKESDEIITKSHMVAETAIRILSIRSTAAYTQLFLTPDRELKSLK